MNTNSTSKSKAVVLLSGGLDSATVLAIAKSEGYEVSAISFNYGQRHQFELQRARQLAEKAGVKNHVVVDINLAQFGGSALTDEIDVPKHDSADDIGSEIPVTYVPARNTVFLSLALAFAETQGAVDIFIGVNALDYSGYPDCRPEFIQAYEAMANLATKVGVENTEANSQSYDAKSSAEERSGTRRIRIHTPLIDLTKAQIIERGLGLGVDYGITISCYDPGEDGRPCEHCDACLLRIRGFEQNGMRDPSLSKS